MALPDVRPWRLAEHLLVQRPQAREEEMNTSGTSSNYAGLMTDGSHNAHSRHCTHPNVAFCAPCNATYCRDCSQEWTAPVVRYYTTTSALPDSSTWLPDSFTWWVQPKSFYSSQWNTVDCNTGNTCAGHG